MCYLRIFKLVSFTQFLNQQKFNNLQHLPAMSEISFTAGKEGEGQEGLGKFVSMICNMNLAEKKLRTFLWKTIKGQSFLSELRGNSRLNAPRKLAALMIRIANYLLSA